MCTRVRVCAFARAYVRACRRVRVCASTPVCTYAVTLRISYDLDFDISKRNVFCLSSMWHSIVLYCVYTPYSPFCGNDLCKLKSSYIQFVHIWIDSQRERKRRSYLVWTDVVTIDIWLRKEDANLIQLRDRMSMFMMYLCGHVLCCFCMFHVREHGIMRYCERVMFTRLCLIL